MKTNNIKTIFYKLIFGLCVALAAGAGVSVCAQETGVPKQYQTLPQITSDPLANTNLIVSPDEDYLIGASDIIELKIEDAPELSGKFRLNSKGNFTLPVVGEIAAKEKTTDQIARLIADKLRGDYLVNPIVNVTVAQSNSRAFFIQGAVRRPGLYQIEGTPSLLKLITIAGGLSENYGPTAFVMREKKTSDVPIVSPLNDKTGEQTTAVQEQEQENSSVRGRAPNAVQDDAQIAPEPESYRTFRANINNLLRGNLAQNLNILPGDIVYIPPTDVFYVVGEVKSPGSFPLKENTTLRQAVSLAQGTNFEANLDQSTIFRTDLVTGRREELKVNIAAVMSGKQEDLEILPNDVLIVPNNRKKTVAKNVLKSFSNSLPMVLLRAIGVW